MKSVLENGVCVSCGRKSGRFYRSCPYCGEQVWQPFWRCAGQGTLLALPPLLLVLLVSMARPDMADFGRAMRSVHPMFGFFFAAGFGLLLMPTSDHDVVLSSRVEESRWQICAILGGWLMGLYTAVCAVCLTYGRAPGTLVWATACLIVLCVAAAPLFFRISWRSLMAAALLAAALMRF